MTIQAQFPDEQSAEGAFTRQPDAFTGWVTANNGSSNYPAASGRYHLYVSWACPWAHRTIIVRKLKKLEGVIGMTVVDPIRDERGWAFRQGPGHSLDPINGFQFLSQAYKATDPNYRGRFTVPVLWDTVTKRIVTNSDDDLMRMFNGEFNRFTESIRLTRSKRNRTKKGTKTKTADKKKSLTTPHLQLTTLIGAAAHG